MVAVINVFYRGQKDEEIFIDALIKNDIVHFVDSTRISDTNWMKQNCKKGLYRCFDYRDEYEYLGKDIEEYAPELGCEHPGMYVLIVDCKNENPNFYEDILDFIQACFDGEDLSPYMELLDMHPVQKTKAFEKPREKRTIEDSQSSDIVDSGYSFEFKKLKDLDCILYQLTKPNTDRPYVVLVKNYSKQGHIRLFSSMRMFDSWGTSKHDIPFLHQVWKHLGEEKEPDLDQILEDHVKACLEGEEEPKVWRNTLDIVFQDYIKKIYN